MEEGHASAPFHLYPSPSRLAPFHQRRSLFAAQLGAQVVAYEEHVDEAELVETSVALNQLQGRVTVRQVRPALGPRTKRHNGH